ncbi:MAG: metal-dependent hydrolase [Bryobacteraceae bacterium]|jgi:inner membrane protein
MDNITHSLVGLMLARAGLNRLGARATALVIIGANLPDIDVVTAIAGRLKYLEYHRGWTHSFALAPVLALLPLPIWWLSTRKHGAGPKSFAYAWLAAFAGVLSHLFLDCWNSYGVRILLPFSDDWYRLDWVYIVDLWIWAILLVGVLGPLLVRLVDSEIGARRGSGRGGAWVVLLLLCGFVALRSQLHAQAVRTLDSRLYDARTPLRVAAMPGPFAPWRWTGLAETERAWHVVPVDLLREYDPDIGRALLKPEERLPQESAVRASQTGQIFLGFTRFPYWRAIPSPRLEAGTLVRVSDLRFGLPEESPFSASFEFDSAGRLVREELAGLGGKGH